MAILQCVVLNRPNKRPLMEQNTQQRAVFSLLSIAGPDHIWETPNAYNNDE